MRATGAPRNGRTRSWSLRELDADQFAHSRLLHGHAVELVGDLHGLARVGDEHELGALLQVAERALERLTPACNLFSEIVELPVSTDSPQYAQRAG